MRPYTDKDIWKLSDHSQNHVRDTPLWLFWEANLDPMTDDYTTDEIGADELMRLWLQSRPDKGTGTVRIYWSVLPVQETAPFQSWPKDLLTHYLPPRHAVTGEQINWARVPVADKSWSQAGDRGGFLQEVTGWKPSALQQSVSLAFLIDCLRAATAG